MSTLITITWSRKQSFFGYNASVIINGEEKHTYDRLGQDPSEAAARALQLQGKFGGRIIACKEVMEIVKGE